MNPEHRQTQAVISGVARSLSSGSVLCSGHRGLQRGEPILCWTEALRPLADGSILTLGPTLISARCYLHCAEGPGASKQPAGLSPYTAARPGVCDLSYR